jgi:hypothetical protein
MPAVPCCVSVSVNACTAQKSGLDARSGAATVDHSSAHCPSTSPKLIHGFTAVSSSCTTHSNSAAKQFQQPAPQWRPNPNQGGGAWALYSRRIAAPEDTPRSVEAARRMKRCLIAGTSSARVDVVVLGTTGAPLDSARDRNVLRLRTPADLGTARSDRVLIASGSKPHAKHLQDSAPAWSLHSVAAQPSGAPAAARMIHFVLLMSRQGKVGCPPRMTEFQPHESWHGNTDQRPTLSHCLRPRGGGGDNT